MRIEFDLTGTNRKELVNAISEITGIEAVYRSVPTCNYDIGEFTVTKDGTLEYPDDLEVLDLFDRLSEKGFTAAETPDSAAENEGEESPEKKPETPHGEFVALTVEIPADKVNTENLRTLLDAKGELIRKALSIPDSGFEETEDTVKFPWFDAVDADKAKAYTHFISALCEFTRERTRISAKYHEVDNEKYAFRCFLLRLGFIGAEYKAERKILLKNLTGSSAFRNGGRNDEVSE